MPAGTFVGRDPQPPGASPTSTGGQSAAPLAVAPTLGSGGALQQVAGATGEVHHVVQVELAAVGEPVRGVPGVATGDGCRRTQVLVRVRKYPGRRPPLDFLLHRHTSTLQIPPMSGRGNHEEALYGDPPVFNVNVENYQHWQMSALSQRDNYSHIRTEY